MLHKSQWQLWAEKATVHLKIHVSIVHIISLNSGPGYNGTKYDAKKVLMEHWATGRYASTLGDISKINDKFYGEKPMFF